MLKKMSLAAAAIAAVFCFSACSSVEIGTSLCGEKLTVEENVESVAHMNAEIWGFYFFSLPVLTGSSLECGKCAVFNDTVNINHGVKLLTTQARAKLSGKYVTGISSDRESVWIMPLLFMWYKSVQVSGNVMK